MSAQASVIVVGAGIMGLSTAWALHRQGVKVTVYEQGAIPNPKGSSLDETRLIRHPYGPQPVYTAMVDDAFSAWGRLFADLATISKEPLYHQTGTLVMDTGSYDAEGNPVVETRRGQAWASASRACLKALGKEYTDLDGIGCARLVPGLDLEVLHDAFYVESGGVLSAGRIVELTAHYLASQGMSIHAHQRVTDIDPELGTVRLADGTTDQADQIVIAAGPWVTRLLPELASKVTPSRQFVVFASLTDDELRAWRQAPMLLDIDPEHGFYTVPPRTSTRLKIGDHRFSLTGDPDDDRDVAQDQAERVLDWAGRRLRGMSRDRLESAKACFYTVEPEERFVLDRIGSRGHVMTGFSGHGFKFGALMGEAMAELVLGTAMLAPTRDWAAGLAERV